MKLVMALIASLLLAPAAFAAQKHDCSGPGYGDDTKIAADFIKDSADVVKDPAKFLTMVCDAKFNGENRDDLKVAAHITDNDIKKHSVVEIAIRTVTIALAMAHAEQHDEDEGSDTPHKPSHDSDDE